MIRPHGYAIWEKMQRELDDRFKGDRTRQRLLSAVHSAVLLTREEQHAAGFAKECAVVTHHRLKAIDGVVQG